MNKSHNPTILHHWKQRPEEWIEIAHSLKNSNSLQEELNVALFMFWVGCGHAYYGNEGNSYRIEGVSF